MKKLTYPVTKNGENVEIIFYIFADGISTNLASNWNIYGHFDLCPINDYLSSLIQFKESYENHFQQHINYNLLPSLLDYDIVFDIQQICADNKLQFPNEKIDFIKTFTDANEMKLVAFQTENQELMEWFLNLNGEKTDSALAANLALTDDMLMLLLKRNAHKYIQFINKDRPFSKRILDFLKQDKRLISELLITKNLDENTICYVTPYVNNYGFYDLVGSQYVPQYIVEFISYNLPAREDEIFSIKKMNYVQPELKPITSRLYELGKQFDQN